jgi:hypothetical protein
MPATWLIGKVQDRATAPLMWTLHAPQAPIPHPNFVPVSPSSSLTAQRRGVSGSPLKDTALPLTVAAIAIRRLQ